MTSAYALSDAVRLLGIRSLLIKGGFQSYPLCKDFELFAISPFPINTYARFPRNYRLAAISGCNMQPVQEHYALQLHGQSSSSLTTKGLFAMARMLRSFLTLSTMFLRIKSCFRITCARTIHSLNKATPHPHDEHKHPLVALLQTLVSRVCADPDDLRV